MKDKLIEMIISVAYKDAGLFDRVYIGFLSLWRKDIRDLLNEYSVTARKVRSLKEDELPEEKTKLLYEPVGGKEGKKFTLAEDIFTAISSKPAAVSIGAFAIIALLVASLFVKNKKTDVEYSNVEIVRAAESTKEVFQIINLAFNSARSTVEDKVLKESVARPIHESYNNLSGIIKEESSNEKIN